VKVLPLELRFGIT